MHFVVSVLVVALLYLGLFHTRINRWVVIVGVLVLGNIGHVVAAGAQSTIGLVAEFVALFAVTVIGLAKRNIDGVFDGLDDKQSDPTSLHADGVAVAARFESLGFTPADDGWQHFPRLGWDGLAMRRDVTNVYIVSGDKGPMFEFVSFLRDGQTVTTVSKATHAVAPDILRQCFPGASLDTLLDEHERAVAWVRRAGRVPEEIALDRLTERMLAGEHESSARARRGVGGAVFRELRKQHLDVGSIIHRPDAVAALDRP